MKLRFHFEIIPPPIYKNTHQEQDFSVTIDETQLQTVTSGPILAEIKQVVPSQLEMKVIGLNVSLNRARFGRARFGDDLSDYLVPVMLHNEGGTIRITAYDETDKLWSRSLTYQLPEDYFPKPQMSSLWKQIGHMTAICQLKKEEIIQEKFSSIGPIHHYIRFSDDYSIVLDLGIQKVVNSQTFEPMTYYIDRVYSLKTLGIYLGKWPQIGNQPQADSVLVSAAPTQQVE